MHIHTLCILQYIWTIYVHIRHRISYTYIYCYARSLMYPRREQSCQWRLKKLKYNQIGAILDLVFIAPKQSATHLHRNLVQAKGSPDKHMHMDPAQLRLIPRRVRSARQELTKQTLDTATVPESLGELIGCCAEHDFHATLATEAQWPERRLLSSTLLRIFHW